MDFFKIGKHFVRSKTERGRILERLVAGKFKIFTSMLCFIKGVIGQTSISL